MIHKNVILIIKIGHKLVYHPYNHHKRKLFKHQEKQEIIK